MKKEEEIPWLVKFDYAHIAAILHRSTLPSMVSLTSYFIYTHFCENQLKNQEWNVVIMVWSRPRLAPTSTAREALGSYLPLHLSSPYFKSELFDCHGFGYQKKQTIYRGTQIKRIR